MTREELAERLEGAECGNRELDCQVARLLGWHRVEPRFTRRTGGGWISPDDFCGTMSDGSPILDGLHGTALHRDPPRFTTDMNAALDMVPEGWMVRKLAQWPEGWNCVLVKGAGLATSQGVTPENTMCAASLRALHTTSKD